MRISDYERAVNGLSHPIILDEVRVKKGHVSKCYGHHGNTLIVWDEWGRGFSTVLTAEASDITHDTHDHVAESCYMRDVSYDLKW